MGGRDGRRKRSSSDHPTRDHDAKLPSRAVIKHKGRRPESPPKDNVNAKALKYLRSRGECYLPQLRAINSGDGRRYLARVKDAVSRIVQYQNGRQASSREIGGISELFMKTNKFLKSHKQKSPTLQTSSKRSKEQEHHDESIRPPTLTSAKPQYSQQNTTDIESTRFNSESQESHQRTPIPLAVSQKSEEQLKSGLTKQEILPGKTITATLAETPTQICAPIKGGTVSQHSSHHANPSLVQPTTTNRKSTSCESKLSMPPQDHKNYGGDQQLDHRVEAPMTTVKIENADKPGIEIRTASPKPIPSVSNSVECASQVVSRANSIMSEEAKSDTSSSSTLPRSACHMSRLKLKAFAKQHVDATLKKNSSKVSGFVPRAIRPKLGKRPGTNLGMNEKATKLSRTNEIQSGAIKSVADSTGIVLLPLTRENLDKIPVAEKIGVGKFRVAAKQVGVYRNTFRET